MADCIQMREKSFYAATEVVATKDTPVLTTAFSQTYNTDVRFSVVLNASGTASIILVDGANTETILMNGGNALTANVLYSLVFPYKVGTTLNIQTGAATNTKFTVLYIDEIGSQSL